MNEFLWQEKLFGDDCAIKFDVDLGELKSGKTIIVSDPENRRLDSYPADLPEGLFATIYLQVDESDHINGQIYFHEKTGAGVAPRMWTARDLLLVSDYIVAHVENAIGLDWEVGEPTFVPQPDPTEDPEISNTTIYISITIEGE